MSARRYPNLTVMRSTGIDDLSGMLPFGTFDLAQVCDDDLIPGTKTSRLLKDACSDFYREASAISKAALGDEVVRSGPFLSVLPRLNGSDFEMVLAWQGIAGVTFVASTIRLPHLYQDDAEFAGHDAHGRIVYFGKVTDLPAAAA